MADANRVTVDLTTSIGTLSFPRVFSSTAGKNDKGETVYDVQFLIPKSDREGVRAILRAIRDVGQAKYGDNWKKVRTPLRDGDKERDELTEDGSTTKGEKYPERDGHYFLNARSSKPVGVYNRQRVLIEDPGEIYAGCKAKIAVTFYPYSNSGNHGVGCGLNGVQKIADGEPIGGGGKPSVESMFDMLDEDDDLGLEDEADLMDEPEPTPPPAKKAAAKKAPAKKAVAKKIAAPEPVEDPEDDLDDLDDVTSDDEDSDLYDGLDDDA